YEAALVDSGEGHLTVHGYGARVAVDFTDDVLIDGRPGPKEFTGAAVERIHNTSLARNAGDHLPPFTCLDLRVNPEDVFRIRCYCGVHQYPLERMIEIPVIDNVLVVPHDLSRVGVQSQCRVVVEVLGVVAA